MAAECRSAATASRTISAAPSRRPVSSLEQREHVAAGQVLVEQRLPEVGRQVGQVERERHVVGEPATFEVDHRFARGKVEAAGDGGRRRRPGRRPGPRCGPGRPGRVSARPCRWSMPWRYLRWRGDGADARDPLDQPLPAEQLECFADGVAGDPEVAAPVPARRADVLRRAARASPGAAGRRPSAGLGRPGAAGCSGRPEDRSQPRVHDTNPSDLLDLSDGAPPSATRFLASHLPDLRKHRSGEQVPPPGVSTSVGTGRSRPRSEQASYGVAQRLLRVDPGLARLGHEGQQPLAEVVASRALGRVGPVALEPVEHLVGVEQRRKPRREPVGDRRRAASRWP